MIEVSGQYVSAEISEVILKLKQQLELNGIKRFYKSIDTPNNYMICCPFHKDGQERKPSMGIHKKTGVCHCFACGWVGSLQEFISNCLGYDDLGIQGSKWLVRNFLTLQIEERKDVELDIDRDISIDSRSSNCNNNNISSVPNIYITEEELDSYRYIHPYWKERGIVDDYIIELFDLGYDEKTDCITFPVRDIKGNCLFVARRSVRTKFFHYPKGVEKPLYGLYELWLEYNRLKGLNPNIQEVIICESMIDALTCWQFGKYAVALNGLGNNLQFIQISKLPCREIILATDNDEAGMKARERISQNIHNKIITQYILPEGKKDINDLSKSEFRKLEKIFV